MKTNDNALVILWKGEEIPDYLVKKIVEILTTNGISIPEFTVVTTKDHDSIVNLLVKDAYKNNTHLCNKDDTIEEACREALIYIATIFKRELDRSISRDAYFAAVLSKSLLSDAAPDELKIAVEIIATNSEVCKKLDSKFLHKYKITSSAIDIIKAIYKYRQM